jgi:uncharacterized RDD family membrane protein YckC
LTFEATDLCAAPPDKAVKDTFFTGRSMSHETPAPSRAGFWRRVVAIYLDVLLLSAIIAVAGLGLARATDGSMRVSRVVPLNVNVSAVSLNANGKHCDISELGPAELQAFHLNGDFNISSVERRTSYAFGIPYNWTLSVSEKKQNGNVTYERNVTLPLDPAGHLTNAFYLDAWLVFFVVAYLLLSEWRFGTTIGKRILGIRVRTLGDAPMDFGQASKRVLMRMVPFLPYMASVIYATVVGPAKLASLLFEQPMIAYAIALAGVGLLMVAFAGNFIVATSRRELPWHDWWARTEAIRPEKTS